MTTCAENQYIRLVVPESLSFGMISQGYIYQLSITCVNKGTQPQRIRISCSPSTRDEPNSLRVICQPNRISPGLSLTFQLELQADTVADSFFTIEIIDQIYRSKVTADVSANVIPLDLFKRLSRALRLQKKELYRPGVKAISKISHFSESNASCIMSTTGGNGARLTQQASMTSIVTSDSLSPLHNPASATRLMVGSQMDKDEMDDLSEVPMTKNTIWDPVDKALRVDKELCWVCVDPSITSEVCASRTEAAWNNRCDILESEGYVTSRTLAMMKENDLPDDGLGITGSLARRSRNSAGSSETKTVRGAAGSKQRQAASSGQESRRKSANSVSEVVARSATILEEEEEENAEAMVGDGGERDDGRGDNDIIVGFGDEVRE